MQACEAVGKLFLSRIISLELRDALNHYTKLASSFPTRSGHHRTLSDSSPFSSRMCSLGFVTIPYSAWEPNKLTSASAYNHSRWIPSPPFSVYWGRAIFSPLVYAHLRRSLFPEAKPCPSFPHWALEFAGSLKLFQASWWILTHIPQTWITEEENVKSSELYLPRALLGGWLSPYGSFQTTCLIFFSCFPGSYRSEDPPWRSQLLHLDQAWSSVPPTQLTLHDSFHFNGESSTAHDQILDAKKSQHLLKVSPQAWRNYVL